MDMDAATTAVTLGNWLHKLGLEKYTLPLSEVGCNELSDLLYVEDVEQLLELLPFLEEGKHTMARIKIMKELKSEPGWKGNSAGVFAKAPTQTRATFTQLDVDTYPGLEKSGFKLPLIAVVMSIMKHGVLPLVKPEMTRLMNAVWAAIVVSTETLYLGPDGTDSEVIDSLLGRLFPQMRRHSSFVGFNSKIVDFMQNVRRNGIRVRVVFGSC